MALTRRKARKTAVEILYQVDVTDGDIDKIIKSEADDFILSRIRGVLEHRDEIDKLIEANAENWSIDRIAVIERNILRLACFELLYCPDVPFKVIIDEAVELGKMYGTEESGAFINGILDNIGKGISSRKKEISWIA